MKKNIMLLTSQIQKLNLGYDFSGMKATFCTAPDEDGQIRVIRYFDTCRESVCEFLRKQIDDGIKRGAYPIDTKRTRLLLFTKAQNRYSKVKVEKFTLDSDKKMLHALKVVNHLENEYKWSKTKMKKVELKDAIKYGMFNDVKDRINMYMVVGSSKWLKSPHLLSLYILIFRLCYRGFKSNFKNHEEFLQKLKSYGNTHKADASYVRIFQDKIDVLLRNYDRLFGKRTLKSLYSKYSLVTINGYNEGISRLCSGLSGDIDISKRFGKICKENNIEYKVRRSQIGVVIR
jgi:uncharacterized protein YeeX (DUF496 family)